MRDDAECELHGRLTYWRYNGAALSPCLLVNFDASEATTMTTAIRPITSVQIALISGFTPSRTSE